MVKESNPEKKKMTDDETILDEQYEFGLNEDTREEIKKEDEDHKESENIADEDDVVIDDE